MILVATDAFKGSLSAREAPVAICPLSDGGEGFVETLVAASGGRCEQAEATDAIGRPVECAYGVLDEGETVVIELSSAAGLAQLPAAARNPLLTSTYGVGTLIAAAYARHRFSRLLLGLGGSATVDGGAGLLSALGVRFFDANGQELPPGGAALARLERIDTNAAHPLLKQVEICLAVDVNNPLVGPRGAARVFAPQKGADAAGVAVLDAALGHYAAVLAASTGRDAANRQGMGSAGGVPAGLWAIANATIAPGFEIAAEALGLDKRLKAATLVVSGEGQLDEPSFEGKVVGRLARRCRALGVPLVVVAGSLEVRGEALLAAEGGVAFSLASGPVSLEGAMDAACELLERAGERVGRLWSLAKNASGSL